MMTFVMRLFVALCAAGLWVAGCALPPPPPPPPQPEGAEDGYEPDTEALLAGAEALCHQAFDLADATGIADTNALNQAIYDSLRWACQLVPDNTNILEAAVFCLTRRELFEEAYGLTQGYLERNPDNLTAHFAAARCAEAADKPEIAAEHCAVIYAANPDDRALEGALIRLYFLAKQDDAAFETMRAAFARNPDVISKSLPSRWAVTSVAQEKNFEKALRCVALALDFWEVPSERSFMWMVAGECHLELERIPEAIDAFYNAYEEKSENVLAIQRLGALYVQYPEVADRIDRTLAESKQADVAKLLLQATLQQRTDKPAAFATLREAYARSMRDGYFPGEFFYLWQVELLDPEQHGAEMTVLLKEAIAVHPASPEIQNTLAYLWAERGENLDEANTLISKALVVVPENAAYQDTKGWVLFKLDRPFEAIQYLTKAADRLPNEPIILNHAGDALSSVGYKEDAVRLWQKSNRIAPNPLIEKKIAEQ